MDESMLTLVVGATGLLGSEVARHLVNRGERVRAMVRSSSAQSKVDNLRALGLELVVADLKDVSSIDAACRGVSSIVSTASATISRSEGDSILSVDEKGQLDLITAAEKSGVGRFVYVSFPPTDVEFALQRAKRKVEERLRNSPLSYVILQPVNFMEVWLSPVVGFDAVNGRTRILGTGKNAVSWVSLRDVARFASSAATSNKLARITFELGGPDALSPLQVVDIFRELGAPAVDLDFVPEAALQSQLANVGDPVQEAFLAIMLTTARGKVVDPRAATELVPGRLTSVREYARGLLSQPGN
jgi:uncharacterized protein YbjT (DUF2867 family)